MNSLNMDFRGGFLRVLVVRDGSVRYSKLVKGFSVADMKSASGKLLSEIKEAGGKKGRVSIILPADIIKFKILQIPAMDLEDAKKLVRREISKELKGQKIVFGIKRLDKDKVGKQDIIAEYALTDDVVRYMDLLKACRIRPDIMTTSLEGNYHLFNRLRPVTDGNEAVIEIGLNYIEIIVFNNGKLMDYKKTLMSPIDDAKFKSKDMTLEQIYKMKIYTIVDTLYNFVMESETGSPKEKLSKLWIGGLGSLAENITGYISDGLGISSDLIKPFGTAAEGSSAFSAIAGVSSISKTEQIINLFPEEMLDERTKLLRRTLLAASLSFYVILLAGSYFILDRTENELKLTYDRLKSDQTIQAGRHKTEDIYSGEQGAYSRIISGSTGLYGIFRDIANLTPSGVTLNSMQIEKAQDATNIKIDATIKYSDENIKNTVLSRYLTSLESSDKMRSIKPPEITILQPDFKKKEISVRTVHEVVQ